MSNFIPILSKKEFPDSIGEIENATIARADVNIIGHFGNCIALDFELNGCNWVGRFMSHRNFTSCIGFVCKAIFETIAEVSDDGISFSELKGVPCRAIVKDSEIVGIGNFIKDRWLLQSAVQKWVKEKYSG